LVPDVQKALELEFELQPLLNADHGANRPAAPQARVAAQRVRAIFVSDVHLGTRACQAERLLEFLKAYEAEYLFLLGDIIDFWAMRRRGVYWSTAQNTLVQKILRYARKSVNVVFVPGNHDEAAREHVGTSFGNIRVERDYVHIAADGRRYLLIHGDEFDQVTRYHRWLALLGDWAYDVLVRLNLWLSSVRRLLRVPGYWSLAGYAKRKVKSAVSFIFDFEDSVLHHARERGVDGVVCGHIHAAAMREVGGVSYLNCGDWVDSCTAIVEHRNGRMELVRWESPESGQAQERLAHAHARPAPQPLVQAEAAWREDDDRRAVLEPPQLRTLGVVRVAAKDAGAEPADRPPGVERM
jgi:UDP-2,3-diacylglucosamine pyrophosphatase LpxH